MKEEENMSAGHAQLELRASETDVTMHMEQMMSKLGRVGGGDEDDDAPECDGINLQCVNSSDFVVGKQTTFNGPVTIINYGDGGTAAEEYLSRAEAFPKEEIVIREKIIAPSTVSEMKAFAEKRKDDTSGSKEARYKKEINLTQRIINEKCFKIPVLVWILLALVILCGCLVYFLGWNGESDPGPALPDGATLIPYNGTDYVLYPRSAWRARPPTAVVKIKNPVPYVVISHTAGHFCYTFHDCSAIVRNTQSDQMSRSPAFADVSYSFMVGGDGNIYEGRGWSARTPVGGFANAKNVDINFIGSFEGMDGPTYPQIEAVKALIEYGVNRTYIAEDYSLIAANSTWSTLSPGIQVYKEIKTWEHFDPYPKSHLKD